MKRKLVKRHRSSKKNKQQQQQQTFTKQIIPQDLAFKESVCLEQEIKNDGLFWFWINIKASLWLLDSEQTFHHSKQIDLMWTSDPQNHTWTRLGVKYLIRALLSLHAVHAPWQRHAALTSIVSTEAVGRRRSLAERYFTAGSWEALLVSDGGGTSPSESFLSVMDQLSASQRKKNQVAKTTSENRSRLCDDHSDSLENVSLLKVVFASVL